jgi:hypothetical protein
VVIVILLPPPPRTLHQLWTASIANLTQADAPFVG